MTALATSYDFVLYKPAKQVMQEGTASVLDAGVRVAHEQYLEIDSPDAVMLMFDRNSRTIAIRAQPVENRHTLRMASRYVACSAFLKQFGITERGIFPCVAIDGTHELRIHLKAHHN
jgi:hypothetical protein